ncbi:MAG: manganese-binding transcriptional regulator MntR [Fimbriimonadales bacterium]|nr:manganese-binding transcriptional regulator MntR [Fimbriimonadales bacterium]
MQLNRYQRTRADHRREYAEDYCELIDDLLREKGRARLCDLAEILGVSNVAVSKTIQRLKREGLLESPPYRPVRLTEKGRALAQKARENHRLVRRYLEKIGVPPEVADADAEGIMHHVSEQTIDAFRRELDGR